MPLPETRLGNDRNSPYGPRDGSRRSVAGKRGKVARTRSPSGNRQAVSPIAARNLAVGVNLGPATTRLSARVTSEVHPSPPKFPCAIEDNSKLRVISIDMVTEADSMRAQRSLLGVRFSAFAYIAVDIAPASVGTAREPADLVQAVTARACFEAGDEFDNGMGVVEHLELFDLQS
jgi:hypothetical protein